MTTDTHRILSFPPRPSAGAITPEALLGPSPAIARTWSQIRRVAPHFRAALITGEPGCGAEAAARSLHTLSPDGALPFETLDAARAERMFAPASLDLQKPCEGLIFLAEVDKLSPGAQRGIVRKLRLRGRAPFRVVAASATELRACVSAGRFSAELAEALGTIRIALPPLRERPEDIPLLATHFIQRIGALLKVPKPNLARGFNETCVAFAWPGNLTQFEQVLHQLLSTNETGTFTPEDLVHATQSIPDRSVQLPAPTRMLRLEDIVQEHIRAVLIACQGNKLRASEVLGISRSTLYRMLDGAVANRHFQIAG